MAGVEFVAAHDLGVDPVGKVTGEVIIEPAQLLADGGPGLAGRFMAELRSIHLDHEPPADDGVLAQLDAAYQRVASQA